MHFIDFAKAFRGAGLLAITMAFSALFVYKAFGAPAPFKVFMIASTRSDHIATVLAAKKVLTGMAVENNFMLDYTTDTSLINDANLAKYQVFLQFQLAPWEMSAGGQKAFENFINRKKGWVGVHFAGLIRPDHFPAGMPYWQWYEDFFGGITYTKHASLQKGSLKFEDRKHPATRNMPPTLQIMDEWYEFSASPRARVHVLATADESTYNTSTPMGDHPLIWSNEKFARMIYVGAGHDTSDWSNATYITLMRDAILWAATSDSAATSVRADSKCPVSGTKARSLIESGCLYRADSKPEFRDPMLFDMNGRMQGTMPEAIMGRWSGSAHPVSGSDR